jgi:PAS domain S-box-containing protein
MTISDEMYRRIIEAVPEGIWVVDSEGKTLFSNRRMSEILGVDFESMPEQSCFGYVYPDELADAQRHFARTMAGDRQPFDFRLRRGDGSPIWVSISCMPVRGPDPAIAPVGLLGLFSDISERRQSEALLRESEKRFRFLVDVAPVMVWVADQDKLCTDFNKPWLDFTGRSLQQELGHGWTSGVHPEDLDRCFASYFTSFDARHDFRMEYRLRRADGEYRWVLDSGTPFYREGEFAGYIGTCIDVTEQKLIAERTRAEAALRESEERQKFLLTLSDALRPLGEPISIQETATRLVGEYLTLDGCGYGEVDLSGETFTVDRDYAAPGVQSFAGTFRIRNFGNVVTERCRAGQNTAVADALTDPLAATPDGIDKYGRVDIRAFVAIPVLKDAQLKALFFGYSLAVRNWTRLESELMADVADRTWSAVERARGEAELRKSEERLRLAAHAARFGTYDVDLVANTVYWSPELRAIIGVPSDAPEKGAREVPDFVHPEDRGRVAAMFSRVFDPDGGGAVLDEHRIIRPDGSVRWVQIRGQTQFAGEGESGRPVRHAGVLLDITERKRDEERLRQTQKLESVGLLAGGIAHDFNNLLTGIVGYASLVLDEIPPGPAAKIREVIAGAERAAHLTRQLLAYSGKGQFKVQDVDVSRAVQEIADLAQFSIPKSVQLSVNVEKRLPLVRMDPGQLQQILMNLVINAGEAVGEGVPGRITVGTSMRDLETAFTDARGEQVAAGRYVCVEISDTGEGISEEGKGRIFEPFYTTKFPGRGLGLAAVEGILRAQRGGITIESVRGAGSSFRIFLPAAENSPRTTVPFGKTGDSGTVLVVDDERSVRDFIGEALRRHGYRVLLASDGREALAICENGEEKIDAVVLDTIMPLMGANELLPLIPGLRPNLRVLLTSGYSESEARRLCVDYPAVDFIGKPYTAHQISKAVEKLLERREGEQNRQLSVE